MQRARVLFWSGTVVAVLGFAALAVYLAAVGWDKADKVASVINLFVALAGLAVAVWGAIASGGSNNDLRVGGSYTEVSRTKGDVVIRRRTRQRTPPSGDGTVVAGDYDRVSRSERSVRIEDQP